MTNVSFVPTTKEHILECVENIREQDKAEVFAAYGHSPTEALERGTLYGAETALADGRVVAIFGIHTRCPLTHVGSPWMLTTYEVEKHRKLFLKYTKKLVNHWHDTHRYMFNYVDAEYVEAIRWLKWLGFTIHPAEPFGPYRAPFHKFDMVNNNV